MLANVFAMLNLVYGLILFLYKLINSYIFYSYIGEHVKRRNKENENLPHVSFYKFALGFLFGIKWNDDYVKLTKMYQDIFSLERILLSDIEDKFFSLKTLTKTKTIGETEINKITESADLKSRIKTEKEKTNLNKKIFVLELKTDDINNLNKGEEVENALEFEGISPQVDENNNNDFSGAANKEDKN